MLNFIIQALLAIFLILIMGFIAYSIYDREYINSVRLSSSNKKETKIFTGVYPFTADPIRIETMNKNDPYYLEIGESVNQTGGAEYSYNFWLYFNIINDKIVNKESDNTTDINNDKYIVLLYKGSTQLIPYYQKNYSCDTGIENVDMKKYILVKNPLVKILNDGSEILVEYNNINTPDTYNSRAEPVNCSINNSITSGTINKLGVKNINTDMYNKTYNMITIVMKENPPNEDELFKNVTNCRVYFNGTLIADRSTYNNNTLNEDSDVRVSTVMKKNIGNIFINPSTKLSEIKADYITTIHNITETNEILKDSPLKMANLSYFNYALDESEIKVLFSNGFDKKTSDILNRLNGLDKKNFNIGNKIDMTLLGESGAALPVQPI